MISEVTERKVSIHSPTSPVSSQLQPPSGEPQQNLRCPRCDSSNTKFCYYNNYNLTQPRHFCKTCRRYWTKGGALRNVPIGGGCRKTKALPITVATAGFAGKSSVSKMGKPASTSEFLARSEAIGVLDHELMPSPMLWASSPRTPHLMALLKAATAQNPNPKSTPSFNPNSGMAAESGITAFSTNVQSADPLTFDTSVWRNSNQCSSYYYQLPQSHSQLHQQNILFPGSGIQEICQKSKLSDNYAYEQSLQAIARDIAGGIDTYAHPTSTMTMATSVTTSAMDPIPLPFGEFSNWNSTQAFSSWADISTANGALP